MVFWGLSDKISTSNTIAAISIRMDNIAEYFPLSIKRRAKEKAPRGIPLDANAVRALLFWASP